MKTRRQFLAVAAGAVALSSTSTAFAATAEPTTIYVSEMHCEHCARKMAGKLFAVKGVVKVQASVEKKLLLVTPQAGKSISPRGVWEAVIAGEGDPVKLVGPSGTFSAKPSS